MPKADEAALIDRANGTVRLIEKKFTLDDKKDFYLSTRVFGCTEDPVVGASIKLMIGLMEACEEFFRFVTLPVSANRSEGI